MITGQFKNISAPRQLAVGDEIKFALGYYALNPGALYWKTFIVADSPTLARKVLEATRELGQEGGFNSRTYNFGRMPDRTIAITLSLWGHNDAGYDWNWGDYDSYMYGSQAGAIPLAWEYIFIDAVIPPPTPVTPVPGLDLKVLKYEILGDAGNSAINFHPLALDDKGHYYKGEVVMLTAIPSSGYKFVKWRGEVDNELSTSLTNTVTMSENRLVKAEFAKIPAPVPTPTPTPVPTPIPTPTPLIPVDWQKWLVPAALVVGAILVLSPKGKKSTPSAKG